MSSVKEYAAPEITVTYDAKRCIHAAECVRALPAVFDPKGKPWIQPQNAAASAVAAAVQGCPTGALQVVWKDGRAAEPVPARNEAHVVADGPVYLRGDIEIHDAAGAVVARESRMALCRCGASGNKPYCDGMHEKIGFDDAGQFADKVEFPAADASGKLVVAAQPDGPAHVKGKLALLRADKSIGASGDECWLCRCGASANKPFCDGSHQKVGFAG